MQRFAEPMARLIDELRKLPGVGTKSAQRFAFHILRSTEQDAAALADAIVTLKKHLRLCSLCNNITDTDPCAYCTSPTRNAHLICVVEEPTNISGIEKTRSFNGLYHVLHGTLSPVNGVGPDQLRLRNLWPRLRPPINPGAPSLPTAPSSVSRGSQPAYFAGGGGTVGSGEAGAAANPGAPGPASGTWVSTESNEVTEVILATSPTVEGEATARYILDELRRHHPTLRVTRIATGVPAGSDIEYADEVTMTRALEGRRDL